MQSLRIDGLNKPVLKQWVKELVYQNHKEDLMWLKKHFGVDLINNEYKSHNHKGKSLDKDNWSVEDVYIKPDEENVRRYESFVIDTLLKITAHYNGMNPELLTRKAG